MRTTAINFTNGNVFGNGQDRARVTSADRHAPAAQHLAAHGRQVISHWYLSLKRSVKGLVTGAVSLEPTSSMCGPRLRRQPVRHMSPAFVSGR